MCTITISLRRVLFDLAVDDEPFIEDLESLEQAIAAFIHLSFVAQIKYPQVGMRFGFRIICAVFFCWVRRVCVA
jgi:hypothetical protein